MLRQRACNRRVRDLTFVLDALGPALAQRLGPRLLPGAVSEVLDGVPVPLMRRCRGERHRLFGDEAGVGRGGSDRDWYDGVRVLARVSNQGLLTGFVIGPAPTDERWLADALLRWSADPEAPAPSLEDLTPVLGASHDKGGGRRGPTGPLDGRWSAGPPSGLPSLGDLGSAGERWTIHWRDDYRTVVLTERCFEAIEDEQERKRWCDWLHGHRQVIETVNELLDHVLHLKLPGARTVPGLLARLGAKVAALNLLVGINHQVGRPSFAHYSPLQ